MNKIWRALEHSPHQILMLLALLCFAGLGFGLYLQHVVGLNPCPMCIVQRYALLLVGFVAVLTGVAARRRKTLILGVSVVLLLALFGAFVAARQSWLQWYPPVVSSCGRDLYGMIETFPLQRVIPMIFRGSGDCTAIDWTFLGGSLANWAFVVFVAIAALAVAMLARRRKWL